MGRFEVERQNFIRAYTRLLVSSWSDDLYLQRLFASPRDVLAHPCGSTHLADSTWVICLLFLFASHPQAFNLENLSNLGESLPKIKLKRKSPLSHKTMVGIFMFEMQCLSFDSTKSSKDLLSNGRRRFQQ